MGTARVEAQHAGTEHITHNLSHTPQRRASSDLVKISLFLSRLTLAVSFCLITLIFLPFAQMHTYTHARTHTPSNIILFLSSIKAPHLHILQATQRKFAMKSLPGKCQVRFRMDLSLQWRELVVCGETWANFRRFAITGCLLALWTEQWFCKSCVSVCVRARDLLEFALKLWVLSVDVITSSKWWAVRHVVTVRVLLWRWQMAIYEQAFQRLFLYWAHFRIHVRFRLTNFWTTEACCVRV